VEGDKNVILIYLWKLMWYNMLKLLKVPKLHSNKKEISYFDIENWANAKVKNTIRTYQIERMRDKSLSCKCNISP
jgi:hypothetical protein